MSKITYAAAGRMTESELKRVKEITELLLLDENLDPAFRDGLIQEGKKLIQELNRRDKNGE